MNTQTRRLHGFTIVELLIVIVVIAILASISMVSYIGAKDRARAEKATVNAATVKKVAESYYSKNNVYPTTDAHFRTGTVTLPSDIKIYNSANPVLDPTTGETVVAYRYISGGIGACIYYWSYKAINSPLTWPGKPAAGQPGRTYPEFLGAANITNCNAAAGSTPAP